LDLESRVDWSEQFVNQHEHDINQTRFETARIAGELDNRIRNMEISSRDKDGFIRFLADRLFALRRLGSCVRTR